MPSQESYLQSEERQKAIVEQKKIFLSGGSVDPGIVNSMILHSWERSVAAHVDPNVKERPRVSEGELKAILEENADLMNCAKNILDQMFSSIQEAVSALSLVSAEGVTLYISNRVSHRTYYPDALVGSINTEEARGTNGIGTCLAERRPVEIIGAEHFRFSGECWSCSAAPILTNEGKLIGVLNVTQPRKQYHAHTHGMVKAAVCAITEQLRLRSLLQQRETIMEMLDDGVLVLSSSGVIDIVNRKAVAMLGGSGSLQGRNLQEVLHPGATLEEILQTHSHIQDQEMLFPLKHGSPLACFVSVVPIAGGGKVITMREAKRMRQVAVQVAGIKPSYTFDRIMGSSAALTEVMNQARLVAGSHTTVLLLGESGTGKELFAQAIHNSSSVCKGPFVAVSCAAIPRDLIESELFGYVGGAFTGARNGGMIGKMELAKGGTLFLDEVNSLPLEMQAKLLRALQQMEIVRIGDTKPTPVDVRIIAATNEDLKDAVAQGTFRGDLYFRLNVIEIAIPPLRERKADIGYLAGIFLDRLSQASGQGAPEISGPALKAMQDYAWPGNIRELENVCERAWLLSGGAAITKAHLPPRILEAAHGAQPGEERGGLGEGFDAGAREGAPGDAPARNEVVASGSVDTVYYELIRSTLDACNGNLSKAAEQLGVARSTLYRRLRKFGIIE